MLKMPSFNPQISVGNLLSIATVIVGIAMGWQAISSTVDNITTRVLKLELEAEKIQDKVTLNELTTQKALTEIQTDMRYVRQSLDTLTHAVAPTRSTP